MFIVSRGRAHIDWNFSEITAKVEMWVVANTQVMLHGHSVGLEQAVTVWTTPLLSDCGYILTVRIIAARTHTQ